MVPTPTVNRHRIAWLVVLLAGAVVAGCGEDSSSSAGTDGNQASDAPAEFGLSFTELAARIEKTEGLIAECMTSAGFQYVAVDFESIKTAMNSDQSAPGVSGDDYIKQYGLGITTQFDSPIVTFGAGPENTASFNGLAPTDQVAFERALWGESIDWNHAHAVEAEDFSQAGGCTRAAAEQTYSAQEIASEYVNPADVLLQQDPRMIAAMTEWSDCMREEGFQYDDPDQVEADLLERLGAVVQGQDPTTLAGPALDALKALQGEELAVADVLISCEEDHIEPVQDEIEAELYGAPQP